MHVGALIKDKKRTVRCHGSRFQNNNLEWIKASDSYSLLEDLYKALDEVIKLAECEIYSYHRDCDAGPLLGRGVIWSFNFFFYNRKLKHVVSFRFCCLR
ncbi:hypothetical protein Nepgr_020145 [Nepenthes gracilis]|uniref:Uncharacterized protein n=1 Tax=Nepenthes gracilis TaxID=150966 RepID=A0AAD3SX34_NEPGR|nr:hypothetical protein Nepgr_020145 [Nepenthes gracilis]